MRSALLNPKLTNEGIEPKEEREIQVHREKPDRLI